MELDATTFVLEIVNFLVLLWLLTRFLYRPIRNALDARAKADAEESDALAKRQAGLDARSHRLDERAAELSKRRADAESELDRAIADERKQKLAALSHEIDAEREKAHARIEEEAERARRQGDRELHRRAAGFVAGYLKRLASPAIEAAVVELFLADLAAQPDAAKTALREGWSQRTDSSARIEVTTAYSLPAPLRDRVQSEVSSAVGEPLAADWRIDPSLIAGISVHLPGHQLEASLRRGVDAFAAEPA